MEVSKSTTTTTHMSVTITTDDLKEIIRNRFNLSSSIHPSVEYNNNHQITISWSEYTNG